MSGLNYNLEINKIIIGINSNYISVINAAKKKKLTNYIVPNKLNKLHLT